MMLIFWNMFLGFGFEYVEKRVDLPFSCKKKAIFIIMEKYKSSWN